MFYVRQENYDPKYPKFLVLKAQKGFGIQNYILYENLATIIENTTNYPKYQHIFLLDDQRFNFFSFEVEQEFTEKVTLQEIQEIINQKIDIANKETKEEFLFSHIDNIKVNGVSKQFIIWEKGETSYRIILVYLNRKTCLEFNDKYGNFHNQKNIEILPESFQTITFLKNNIKNENFLLLYIRDSHCKGVVVEKGFYKQIENINLGVNALMQMYKDNGISKYWYKNYEEIENNPFAKNLVVQTLEFYAQMLCKWIQEEQIWGNNIFVISPIMKNAHFMEIFNKEYSKFNNNYIVPFHYSDHLERFWKQREPEDIDALIYINKAKAKEIEGLKKD